MILMTDINYDENNNNNDNDETAVGIYISFNDNNAYHENYLVYIMLIKLFYVYRYL